ncbi:efflux transporter outer membrane subunit [Azohydromonas lata]|uniref:efflux transporter outer membrane subunit n=1 Tax=Azohydromonas lata TaxID=45677 RepID=UPI000A06C071|nr:efflux transporter outer membrane subunit [Azohydromonas lata]
MGPSTSSKPDGSAQPNSPARLQAASQPRPIATAALLAALLLAGCASPRPTSPLPPPAVETPAAWRTPIAEAQDIDAAWWRRFNDPVLDALVAQALQRNADLATARARVAEYEARQRVAAAGLSPTLALSAGPARARARTPAGTVSESTLLQAGVQAAWEVDLWGRLRSLEAAALAQLQGQRAAADAAALSIAATTANGYFNLRSQDAQLDLARATLASREESLRRAQRLFEEGYSSRLDFVQAEAELHTAAGAVAQLERAVAQQENALAVLAGRAPGPLPRGMSLQALQPPAAVAGLPSSLLRRRPDLAQAEQAVAAADAAFAAARDQLLPALNLSASATYQGFTLHQLLDAPTLLWSVGASVLAPVFQGGRLRAQADVAQAQREQALHGYEQAARTAFAEVDNALASIASLRVQAAEAALRRDAALQALRIARNRYRNGYASYLEELDAQRGSYAAEQGVLQVQGALLAAHVDLARALGGGWRDGGETPVSASRDMVVPRQ